MALIRCRTDAAGAGEGAENFKLRFICEKRLK
jgi:hypothetical protein